MPALPWKEFQPVEPGRKYAAMASRLPLLAHRSIPGFLLDAMRIRGQLAHAPGLVGYALNAQPARKTFWTISVWTDELSLSTFAAADPHRALAKELQPQMGPEPLRVLPDLGRGSAAGLGRGAAAAGDRREKMKKELSYRTDPWFPQPVGAPRHSDSVTRVNSSTPAAAAGTWQLGDLTVNRLGFGAMRLTGSQPFAQGSPSDRGQSIAVLRRAVELGVNHIDTAAFYFSALRSANELINTALAPYADDLVITTKVGPGRDSWGEWHSARPDQLRGQVEENLRQLGRDQLDVVNLRRERSGVDRRALRRAGRPPPGRPDPPPRRLRRQRRPADRGAADRAGRLRAEPVRLRPARA